MPKIGLWSSLTLFKDMSKIQQKTEERNTAFRELAALTGIPFNRIYDEYIGLAIHGGMTYDDAFNVVYAKYSNMQPEGTVK